MESTIEEIVPMLRVSVQIFYIIICEKLGITWNVHDVPRLLLNKQQTNACKKVCQGLLYQFEAEPF